jgi:hypothetical protein
MILNRPLSSVLLSWGVLSLCLVPVAVAAVAVDHPSSSLGLDDQALGEFCVEEVDMEHGGSGGRGGVLPPAPHLRERGPRVGSRVVLPNLVLRRVLVLAADRQDPPVVRDKMADGAAGERRR